MVVFHIISSIDIGGAEQVAFNIAKYSKSDIEYHIIEVIKADSVFSDKIKKDLTNHGIKFHTSHFRNNKIAILLFWTWFWIPYLKYRPQILHAHTEVPDLSLKLFRSFSWFFFWIKPKFVRTIHNTQLWNKWKWIAKYVEPFYQRNKSNIAISEKTCDYYNKNFGGKVTKIINNGIPFVTQKALEEIDKNKINILFAGRFENQKGFDIMIEVVKHFLDNPKYVFYIIGSGSGEHTIRKNLENHSNVIIKDKVYGLNQYLGNFDYLFLPSRFEGLALLPIEASMAKTPSIISDCPGLKETFPDTWILKSKSNLINDYISIIEGLQKGKLGKELGEEAFNYAKENFSVEKMIKEYENYYSNLKFYY